MLVHIFGVEAVHYLLPVAFLDETPGPLDPVTCSSVIHTEPVADIDVGMSYIAEAEELLGHCIIDLSHLGSFFLAIVVMLSGQAYILTNIYTSNLPHVDQKYRRPLT